SQAWKDELKELIGNDEYNVFISKCIIETIGKWDGETNSISETDNSEKQLEDDSTTINDNSGYSVVDSIGDSATLLNTIGDISGHFPTSIAGAFTTGAYIVTELNGTFEIAKSDLERLAANMVNYGAEVYNAKNRNTTRDAIPFYPITNVKIDETFFDLSEEFYASSVFIENDCKGLYWDEMNEDQKERMINAVKWNDYADRYTVDVIFKPFQKVAVDMIYAIYCPIPTNWIGED
ncbi:MAG: hypothetical protein AAGU75_24780, partial [Bacillota bacterium]